MQMVWHHNEPIDGHVRILLTQPLPAPNDGLTGRTQMHRAIGYITEHRQTALCAKRDEVRPSACIVVAHEANRVARGALCHPSFVPLLSTSAEENPLSSALERGQGVRSA